MNITNLHKTFQALLDDNDLEKGKSLPVGTINKYNEMKMPDGTWKYVGKKGSSHPDVKHLFEKKGIEIDYTKDVNSSFQPGDVHTKNGKLGIKVAPGKWMLYDEYVKSWGGNPPTKQEEKIEEKIETSSLISKLREYRSKVDSSPVEFDSWIEDTLLPQLKKSDYESIVSDVELCLFLGKSIESLFEKKPLSVGLLERQSGIDLGKSLTNIKYYTPFKGEKADFTSCTKSQLALINSYTKTLFLPINRYGAGKLNLKVEFEGLENIIKLSREIIDEGLNNIVNLKPVDSVYRSYRGRKSRPDEYKDKMVNYMMGLGQSRTYNINLSTSETTDSSFTPSENSIYYKIENVHTGKLISEISKYGESEKEVLFPTTSKFKVINIEQSEKKSWKESVRTSAKSVVILKEVTDT